MRERKEHRRWAALSLGLAANHDLPGTWFSLAAAGAAARSSSTDKPAADSARLDPPSGAAGRAAFARQTANPRTRNAAPCLRVLRKLACVFPAVRDYEAFSLAAARLQLRQLQLLPVADPHLG